MKDVHDVLHRLISGHIVASVHSCELYEVYVKCRRLKRCKLPEAGRVSGRVALNRLAEVRYLYIDGREADSLTRYRVRITVILKA